MWIDPILETGDVSPLLNAGGADGRTLRMAAAMASAAYGLELEPFLATGWQDACAQLGGRVTDGLNLTESRTSPEGLRQARRRLDRRRQITRSLPASLVEMRSGSGVKALIMLRRLPDGRFVVAISFMGSVELDDWIANFDMINEDGLHRGYLRRAEAFEALEEEIDFPQAAEQLGLERLTLRTVVEACARDSGWFRLFLTGHSLGAAVMQVYALRLLRERGVRPKLVQGVGFASPMVAAANALDDPSAFPLWHVLNSDDCVPCLGAEVHLGLCLRCRSDWDLRRACYGLSWDEETFRAERLVMPIYTMMRDTPSALSMTCGILQAVIDKEPADFLPALGRIGADRPAIQRILEAGDNRSDRFLRRILHRAEAACVSVCGHGTDPALVEEARRLFAEASEELGLKGALNAMVRIGSSVHAMQHEDGTQAPYQWIAQQEPARFEPFTWAPGRPPVQRAGRWSP